MAKKTFSGFVKNMFVSINQANLKHNSTYPIFKSKPVFSDIFHFDKKILTQDVVEIPKLSIKISQLYSKLQKKVSNPTVQQVERLVDSLSEKYPRDDVLLTLRTLTQYSNMKSLVKARKALKGHGIGNFSSYGALSFNSLQSYLRKSDIRNNPPVIPIGYNACLSDIFDYFFNSCLGKCPLPEEPNRSGIIIDKQILEILELYRKKAPLMMRARFLNANFFYLKNFENTYNIFEQHQDLEKMAQNCLKRLSLLKEHFPKKSSKELLDVCLNGKNEQNFKSMGIKYTVIDTTPKTKPTVEDIVKNLSSEFPSQEVFTEKIEKVLNKLTTDERKKIAYFDEIAEKLNVYTFKSMSDKLRELKTILEKDLVSRGKCVDDIYYFVPNNGKSFGLVAYMYKKINNIPDHKFIDLPTNTYKNTETRGLNDKITRNHPTIVVLDDASITCESFINQFELEAVRDYDLVFAPILATDKACECLNNAVKKNNNNRMVYVDYVDICSKPF